ELKMPPDQPMRRADWLPPPEVKSPSAVLAPRADQPSRRQNRCNTAHHRRSHPCKEVRVVAILCLALLSAPYIIEIGTRSPNKLRYSSSAKSREGASPTGHAVQMKFATPFLKNAEANDTGSFGLLRSGLDGNTPDSHAFAKTNFGVLST